MNQKEPQEAVGKHPMFGESRLRILADERFRRLVTTDPIVHYYYSMYLHGQCDLVAMLKECVIYLVSAKDEYFELLLKAEQLLGPRPIIVDVGKEKERIDAT